jgi:hypothetical protein
MRTETRHALFWLVAIIATVVAAHFVTHAADDQLCKLYSREMTRAYVRSTPAEDLPSLTVDQLQFRLTQYWTLCLNRDEPPAIKDLPSDGKWVADLWSEIQRSLPRDEQIGAAPATEAPAPTPKPAKVLATKPVAAVHSSGAPQPLCASHHMRTVYQGLSWRCLK